MPETLRVLGVFGLVLGAGLALTVPAYQRLLRRLADEHPAEYAALGRPVLLNGSPRRSWALQRFIYVGSREPGIAPEVTRLCRFLGVVTPLSVIAVFATIGWLLRVVLGEAA